MICLNTISPSGVSGSRDQLDFCYYLFIAFAAAGNISAVAVVGVLVEWRTPGIRMRSIMMVAMALIMITAHAFHTP
jgi:hypothetical protein